MSSTVFTLGPDATFRRDGAPFLPVGVNYWPASCGVEMWAAWPADEIRADLALVRRLGLNTVRFFLRWQDFEPEAGRYDERAWARLDELLGWFRAEGVVAHPSLFVGFMSGGVFWPAWKGGRNLFSDPAVRARAAAFAARAATVCARHRDVVLALDQGNELCCLAESLAAPPADVISWCGMINDAIRGVWPNALIVSGNEQNQVIHDTGWRFGQQPGTDFLSMHAYPVATWHAVAFDGMGDPLCRSLLPFYTACARAFAPVMVQEFGTLLTAGAEQVAGYLGAVLPACAAAGANGYLWWCLRDIATEAPPYAKHPFERGLGLVDRHGRVKPGLEVFTDWARQARAEPPAAGPRAGLYWPAEYYPRDNPRNPGNSPRECGAALALAHFALGQHGRAVRVVRGERPLPPPAEVPELVVSGVRLMGPEWSALRAWVEQGGRLLVLGVDAMAAGEALHGLLGAAVVDFRAPAATAADGPWEGRTWRRYPRDVRAQLRADEAEVLCRSEQGDPLVVRHRLGRGLVVALTAEIDREAAAASADPAARRAWLADWRALRESLLA